MNFPSSGTIMKTQQYLRTLATAVLLGAPVSLLAQGPLTPPGPPAPMMKTLVEMEPRTHIVSLPFTITAPGSYYLTTNLNGGGSSTGIVIQASGVTIDLRGFSIENCTSGISASGMGVKEVAIHNGGVRGCTGNGIDLGGVSKVRVESVMVSDNGGDGASVGEASLVTLCTAKGNGGNGIALGSSGKVFQCVSQSNGGSGIAVTSSCQVADNNCNNHDAGAGLFTLGDGNRVEDNSSNQNKFGFLINGTANLVIRNNACSNSASDYSVSAGNNYGQVLVSPGAAFASSNAWANFGCGPQNPGGCATAADCDDSDACTTDVCQAAVCSNTPIPDCSPAVCGDGIVQAGEACDDGNTVNGDGCTSTCQAEGCNTAEDCPGSDTECQSRTCNAGVCGVSYSASGTAAGFQTTGDCQQTVCNGSGGITNVANNADLPADDGNQCTIEVCTAGIPSNSYQPYGTACAQNGGVICDGSGTCISNAVCGDGIVQAGETCDDGNTTNGDGCTAICSVQSGFTCLGSPSVCFSACGDGLVAAGESCDDANVTNGDGCSAVCSIESGFSCAGSPSVCSSVCGDGLVAPGEACDDANVTNGDGCNAICSVESGFNCAGSPSVCAAINYSLNSIKTGTGAGTVTSSPAGITCGADCSEAYSSGTLVSLNAAAASGSTFAGWSGGGCSGVGSCAVTMNSATTVSAMFTLNTYLLTVTRAGIGSGTVTSAPSGISCGADCTEAYFSGTNVTITATPQSGSTFAGWSGACSGTGTCVIPMTSAKTVTATFN